MLQSRLDELAAAHDVVGASAAVMRGDSVETAATGTASLRTGQPVTDRTLFQIGSITKVFTATLVMQLVDDGLVDLDEPVRSYLPDFALGDPAAAERITTRHLLSHTSGIDGDIFDDFGRGDDCLERYVAGLSAVALTSPPGALFSYCNAGYVVLATIVERLRALTWDAALRRHLLDPIGMHDTATLPEEVLLLPHAVGHMRTGEGGALEVAPAWHLPRATGPAGAICATTRDLLAFVRMHRDEGRAADGAQVLSPASVKAMRDIQVSQPDPTTLGDGWGLGWILYRTAEPSVHGHDGATLGQQAYLRVVPGKDVSVTLLTNGGNAGALFEDLFGPLLEADVGAKLQPVAVPPSAPVDVDPAPFLGTFERSGVRITIRRADDGRLLLQTEGTGPLAELVPDEPPKPLDVLDETRLITAEREERLGRYVVLAFLERGPDGFSYVHLGGRATPRVG